MGYDRINPDHYKLPNGTQVIDVTETLNFNLGNVVKYAARAGRKPDADVMDDLYKARWYLEREINRHIALLIKDLETRAERRRIQAEEERLA